MPKSHSLNLYDVDTSAEKFEIDVTLAAVDVKVGGTQSVVFYPPLKLIDSVGGDIESVSTKLHSIDSAIATVTSDSAAATAVVQTNLTAYQSSNNSSVATLNAIVVANKATSDTRHEFDATARAVIQTSMEALITTEKERAEGVEGVLTDTLATEVTNRTNAITSEATTRAAEDTDLKTQIDAVDAKVDAILHGSDVNLDQFHEVVTAYQNLNTSAVEQIATLNTDLSALTARVDALTSSE